MIILCNYYQYDVNIFKDKRAIVGSQSLRPQVIIIYLPSSMTHSELWCWFEVFSLPLLWNGSASSQKVDAIARNLRVNLPCEEVWALFIRLQSLPQDLPNQLFSSNATTTSSSFSIIWWWCSRSSIQPQNLHLFVPCTCSSNCCFLCRFLSCHLYQV